MALKWARNGVWALLVMAVGAGASYLLLVSKPAPVPESPPAMAPPVVDVVVASPSRRSLTVETQGTVRPLREIKLISQVGGRVESVSPGFAVGGFFTAGETLLQIEGIDYQFAISRAESQVAAARQRLAEERGRALQAEREWRDLGSEAANALFLRKPQIASAEAALRAAQADLDAALLDLKRTAIAVPFNRPVYCRGFGSGLGLRHRCGASAPATYRPAGGSAGPATGL
jgi:multidrug efflux pump subunit AcrA (membrane-fusion protein)